MIDLADLLILGGATLWLALSIAASLLIGRVIRHRDEQRPTR